MYAFIKTAPTLQMFYTVLGSIWVTHEISIHLHASVKENCGFSVALELRLADSQFL